MADSASNISLLLEATTPRAQLDQAKRRRAKVVLHLRPLCVDFPTAAAAIGVRTAAFRKLVSSGRAPQPIRLGRRCVFPLAILEKWVSDGMRPVSAAQADRWQRHVAKQLGGLSAQ